MKNLHRILAGLTAVSLSLALTACSSAGPSSKASLDTIKIGMVGNTIGPVGVAINDGAYKAAGLDVQAVTFNAGADGVKALVGGSLDLGQFGYEHVLRQINNGLDVKAFALVNNSASYQLIVKKDSPYKTLSDLKGQTLGVTEAGSLSDSTLKYLLAQDKLDPTKDVQIINAGIGATMSAAISTGKIAAGMVSEPTTSQMVATGDYRVLVDPSFQTAGLVIIGKTAWAKSHSKDLETFLKVTESEAKKTAADPSYGEKALKKWYPNLTDSVLTSAVENVFKRVPLDLKVTEQGTTQVLNTQLEEKTINKSIPYSQGVDLSYLPK